MNLKPYPKYKDSAVPWLRQIPDHWEIHRHGQLFREIVDIHHPDLELLSMTITHGIVKQSATGRKTRASEDKNQYKRIGIGDIGYNLMNCFSGAIGVSNYEGILSPAYAVCRPRQPLETWYYHYLFRTPIYKEVFNSYSYGIMFERNRLYFERFKLIRSPLPPKDEQIKIVKFLRFKSAQISRFIRAKKRIIELLKEQKQAIINQAVTRGLDPNVKLKPSGVEWLGEIPEHWEVLPLKRVTLLNPSKTETKMDNSSEEKVVFLPMEKISVDGSIDCSELLPFKQVCNGFTYFRKGDVIIAKITPCFENGKGAFLNKLATDFGFGTTELIVLRPGDKMLGQYLRLILSSKQFLTIGAQFMTGSAGQKRIPTEFIMNYIVPLPSIEEQIEICNIIGHKSEKIDFIVSRTEREISLMREYRARLIADVVTGKVDVRDIEVPDVTEEELIIEDRDEMKDAEETIEEAEDEE